MRKCGKSRMLIYCEWLYRSFQSPDTHLAINMKSMKISLRFDIITISVNVLRKKVISLGLKIKEKLCNVPTYRNDKGNKCLSILTRQNVI